MLNSGSYVQVAAAPSGRAEIVFHGAHDAAVAVEELAAHREPVNPDLGHQVKLLLFRRVLEAMQQ
eukprot:SAG11_NODE_1620_length_4569_cov_2.059955_4_plen_65_part_00